MLQQDIYQCKYSKYKSEHQPGDNTVFRGGTENKDEGAVRASRTTFTTQFGHDAGSSQHSDAHNQTADDLAFIKGRPTASISEQNRVK